jgi:trk system potassium uptake protein TrkA
MKRQVVVIGLGRFGATIASTLVARGHEVVGIDSNRERVEEVSHLLTHVVQADAADEQTLRDLGLENYDVGIVAVSKQIEASVMTTLLLKRLGVRRLIARASNALHEEILFRIGADRVVIPEREMGVQVAHTFGAPQIEDYLEVADTYGLSRLRLPAAFAGRTLGELDLPARCGLTVVLIRRGERTILQPPPDARLQPDDQIVVAGTVEALEKLAGMIVA